MAEIIAVQFGAVDQAATDCRSMATSLQGTLADLKAYLDKLVWTGSARVAYDADQQQWNQGAHELQQIVTAVSTAVGTANHQFQATEAANTGRFSR
jgi:WXG100 family type VII secretion target